MTRKQPTRFARLRRQPPRRRLIRRVELILWILAALCTIGISASLAFLRAEASDRILRGVEAMGVNLGGMSRPQAATALQNEWEQRKIEVIAGDVVGWYTPTELGMLLDADGMAATAHILSRRPGHLESVLRGRAPVSVEAYWALDASLAEARLRALASDFDRARRDASLRMVGTTVEALPAQPGRALHVLDSVAWLREHAAEVLALRRWNLQILTLPPVAADVSAAVAEARQLLTHFLTLHLYDPIVHESLLWTVGSDVWAPWLQLYVDAQQSDRLQWEVDAGEVEASLREQIDDLSPGLSWKASQAVSAVSEAIGNGSWQAQLRVYHEPSQHTVREGETLVSIASDYGLPYPWIEQANPGVSDDLSMGQVLQIPSPDVLLPLPIVPGKRITVSLGSQMMWAYENDALKWQWPVSTGRLSSPTTTGVFQIQSHELDAYAPDWDLNMPHFMGIYRPVPDSDVMNGFHGFPSRGGAQVVWTDSLGQQVTYGCILVSSDNAALLYDWAEDGTIVVVRP